MAGYDYGPSENELVLNVTSQLLHEMSTRYPASTALAPTRRKENVLGYDVDVRELLGAVFQFKRPSAIRARTHPTRLPKRQPRSLLTPQRTRADTVVSPQWPTQPPRSLIRTLFVADSMGGKLRPGDESR